jgi:hypothetical protein
MLQFKDSFAPLLLDTITHARACSPDDGTDATLEPEMIDDPFGAAPAWDLHDAPAYLLH